MPANNTNNIRSVAEDNELLNNETRQRGYTDENNETTMNF